MVEDEDAALGAAMRQLLRVSYGMLPDALGDVVAATIEEHLGGTDVVLLLVDLDQIELRPFDPAGTGRWKPLPVDGSLAGIAFQEERATSEEVAGGRRVWVPILDSSERMGVLGVTDDGSLSLAVWLDLASLIGEIVMGKDPYGDAIANARRTTKVTLAAEMRWGLLPPLTFTSPVVSVSGILQPSHLIAGDAFDYAVDSQTASVALFDAMGHGLEASRMANLAIGLYRNARRRGDDIAETLVGLDQIILSEFGDARFITAQLASLDLASGELRIVSAGHPYPVRLRHGEGPSAIECPPCRPAGLGVGDPTVVTIALQPGDAVLFHSDGVSDARSPAGESFGEERMADMACELLDAHMRPAEVLRRVMHHAIAFQGPRVRDDASLVLLRWCPEAIGEPEDPVQRSEEALS